MQVPGCLRHGLVFPAIVTMLGITCAAANVAAQTAPLLPEPPPKKAPEQGDQPPDDGLPPAARPSGTPDAPATVDAPPVMQQPAPPPPEPMLIYMELGTGVAVPIGDTQFGLRPFKPGVQEFEWSPGFEFAMGVVPPGRFLNIGLRAHFGLGPLNSDAWTDALGVLVDDSILVDVGIYAQYQLIVGKHILVAGMDGGFVSLGTTTTEQSEDGDVTDVVPNKIGYTGFTGGAYVGVMRQISANGYLYLRARYGFRSWGTLSTDGPDPVPAVQEDASQMNLGHVLITLGICGMTVDSKRRRNW